MTRHGDNIGFLRLVFASAVIVSHSPALLDGDRTREPLTILFHTLSLGELSVDAFFLLSGYLIAASWSRQRSLSRFLERRVLRIYPAFIVASLLCCFLLAPNVGADPWVRLPEIALRTVLLQQPPEFPGQLSGLAYPFLNGSMWTIPYEFRCYLLLPVLGLAGWLDRPLLVAALACAGVAGLVLTTLPGVIWRLDALGTRHTMIFVFGAPSASIRLTAAFLVGTSIYSGREWLLPRLNGRVALGSALLACVLLYRDPHLAEAGLLVLGGVALFWLALRANLGPLQRINDRWDISYGVYLYGWPVATGIVYAHHGISPLALDAITLPVACVLGAMSWWGVEKWTKDLARSRREEPVLAGS